MLHFRRSNHRPVKIIKDGNVVHTNSERICVGDIILLSENEVCPCDAVLLSSSHESHQASHIQLIVNCKIFSFFRAMKQDKVSMFFLHLGVCNDSKLGWGNEFENKVFFEIIAANQNYRRCV